MAGVSRHGTLTIDLQGLGGGSALTADLPSPPKDRPAETLGVDIPATYVPARNTIFLSFALAWAGDRRRVRYFHRGQRARLQRLPRLPAGVFRRVRADGESRHPRGRRSGRRLTIRAPLLQPSKAGIIQTRPRAGRRFLADANLL